MISAGRLRHLALQKLPPATSTTLGLRGTAWTDGQYFRCDIRPTASSEQPYADGVATVTTTELRARWKTVVNIGLTTAHRIEARGKTFRIRGIVNLDERDSVAVIDCEVVE